MSWLWQADREGCVVTTTATTACARAGAQHCANHLSKLLPVCLGPLAEDVELLDLQQAPQRREMMLLHWRPGQVKRQRNRLFAVEAFVSAAISACLVESSLRSHEDIEHVAD